MNRRKLLKVGASLGALTGLGAYGRHAFLPPGRSRRLDTVDALAARLFDGLDAGTRERACVPYDHPLRQYHNRGVNGGGIEIGIGTFDRAQRRVLTDLLHAGLSEPGRDRLPEQFFIQWLGVHLMNVVVCGNPSEPPYQIVLTGPHLNLRLGGASREGVAFGGPQVYGEQRGNERVGLPGSVYRFQLEIARRLHDSLSAGEREAATVRRAPPQTQIELRGAAGPFDGVAVGSLSAASRAIARELADGMLSTYAGADVEYALACLERNGGTDGLHVCYYEEADDGGGPEPQIVRLEGPAAVLYYRGYPHLHAFVNVGMDGERPLSVGEDLGENPAVLEGAGVKALFERAMREEVGADLAYYDPESVAGRLRAGPIRSGDVYCLESWQNHVAVVEIDGGSFAAPFLGELRERGIEPVPGRRYTVATTDYLARNEGAEKLGRIESRRRDVRVRDATIAYLKRCGFPRGG